MNAGEDRRFPYGSGTRRPISQIDDIAWPHEVKQHRLSLMRWCNFGFGTCVAFHPGDFVVGREIRRDLQDLDPSDRRERRHSSSTATSSSSAHVEIVIVRNSITDPRAAQPVANALDFDCYHGFGLRLAP